MTVEDNGAKAEAVEVPVEGAETNDEVLGDAGKKALQAEREARKQALKEKSDLEKAFAEAQKRIDAFEDAQRTDEERRLRELEKAQEVAKAAEDRAAKAERRALLATIATEEGIPASHIHRIVGDTEDELRADAKALAESLNLGGPRKPAPVPEAGSTSGPKVSTADQFSAAIQAAFNR